MTDFWAVVHDYRRAANEGRVPPLVCDDGTEYMVWHTIDGEPQYICPLCNRKITPGVAMIDRLRRMLK